MRIPKILTVWFMLMQAVSAGDIDAMADTLSEEEDCQSEMIQVSDMRDRYIASHALARSAVSDVTGHNAAGMVYQTDPMGKPRFYVPSTGERIDFSLSRTDGMVACAQVDDLDLGVDVECIRPKNADRAVAQQLFSRPEQDHLAGLSGAAFEEAFFRIWTLKEAYVKAEGGGLSMPLDDFAFDPGHARVAFLKPSGRQADDWFFVTKTIGERYVLSLAARNRGHPVKVVYKQLTPAEVFRRSGVTDQPIRRLC